MITLRDEEAGIPNGPVPVVTLKTLWGSVCDECLKLWHESPRRAAEVLYEHSTLKGGQSFIMTILRPGREESKVD